MWTRKHKFGNSGYIHGQYLQQYGREINKLWIQKKTGLNLYQSEPTTEVALTREEQILNLGERFDKFACRNECSSFV